MNYYAIIGDIKTSKKLINRNEVQEQLKLTLNHINDKYPNELAAKFLITLGDEFQGLLVKPNHLLEIIDDIQRELYPVKLRFGVGIGKITTKIFPEAAIGSDGPAFYAARNTIESIHEQEKKEKKQAPDIQIAFYEKESFEAEEINIMLKLLKIIENNWSEKQRYTIWDIMTNGGNQKSCAARMGTTQSTVARRLADGNYITYKKTRAIITKAINTLALGEKL